MPAAAGTPGLKFDLTNDGKGYVVSRGTVALGDIVIPSSYNNLPVTLIKNLGFANSPIGSVIIPASVTEIGDNAFAKCASLNSVTIQGTIPANKFWGFDGDLKTKYLAGGAGTYTRSGTTWTKK